MESNTVDTPMQALNIEQLSASPSIWLIRDFLSPTVCDHLITLAKDKLERSRGHIPDTGEEAEVDIRTSSGMFLMRNQDAIVTQIENRIAALVNLPVENGEGMQILRYQIGQEYQPHYDYFDPAFPGSSKVLERGGQRVVTVLMYLNEVEAGGGTIFPKIDLVVPPMKGAALIFYSVFSDGQLDTNSLHGGMPVEKGEKWVATKWIRQRTFV